MKKIRRSVMIGLFVTSFAGMFAMNGQASLIASEKFDYEVGSVSGETGGSGWGGGWIASTSGGRSYIVTDGLFSTPTNYNYSASSPYLSVTAGTASAQASRMLSSSFTLNPVSTTTYYFSTLVSVLDDGTSNDAKYFPRFVADNTAALVSFGIGGDNRIRINTGSSTAGSFYMTEGSNFVSSIHYLAVGKLVLNPSGTADEFYFSLIDASSAVSLSEPGSWDATRLVDISGTVAGVAFYSAANSGTVNVDSFYFGTDYASVIPEPSTFVNWMAPYAGSLSAAEQEKTADPDNDTMDNFLEYALGGNPTTNDAASILPVNYITDDGLMYLYNRRTDYIALGLSYDVELTSDLVAVAFSNDTSAYVEIGVSGLGGDFETVSNRIVMVEDVKFITLKVEE